jgi:hypothetical protein
VAAELLRAAAGPSERRFRGGADLAAALWASGEISGIRVEPGEAGQPRALCILMPSGGGHLFDLLSFEPVPARGTRRGHAPGRAAAA